MPLDCTTPCVIPEITLNADCKDKAGIKSLYWAAVSDIDLDASAANVAAGVLSAWVMQATAVFKKIEFERQSGFYTATYTEDADAYDVLIQMIMNGKDEVRTEALRKALGCCRVVVHTVDYSCAQRVFGLEWDGTSLYPCLKPLRIVRHLDASGQKGTDLARDEMDIGGLQDGPALFSSMDESAIPV